MKEEASSSDNEHFVLQRSRTTVPHELCGFFFSKLHKPLDTGGVEGVHKNRVSVGHEIFTFFNTPWLTWNHNLCRTSSSNSFTCDL